MAEVNPMLMFDEQKLIQSLEGLPDRGKTAFATATATRQLSNYERFARNSGVTTHDRPREIVNRMWSILQKDPIDRTYWQAQMEIVMQFLPDENDQQTLAAVLADDAISSLEYSIRCLLSPSAQEAAWAARRAYEAADQIAILELNLEPGSQETELKIASHDLVQRELSRQARDLETLAAKTLEDSIHDLHLHSLAEELMTDIEAGTFE